MTAKYELASNTVVVDNGYSLDLWVDNKKVHLFPQSQKILRLLIESGIHNWKVPREKMYECLWGEYQGTEKNCNDTIRSCIKQLRDALGRDTICNEYGVGYYLRENPRLVEEPTVDKQRNDAQIIKSVEKIAKNTGLLTESEPPIDSIKHSQSLDELMLKVVNVSRVIEDVYDTYNQVKALISDEVSHCGKKSAIIDSYLIALLALSDKLENQLGAIQDLGHQRDECEYRTKNLVESRQFIPASLSFHGRHASAIRINKDEFAAIEQEASVLEYRASEIKHHIDEIYNEFDFLQSTKERFIKSIGELPF